MYRFYFFVIQQQFTDGNSVYKVHVRCLAPRESEQCLHNSRIRRFQEHGASLTPKLAERNR